MDALLSTRLFGWSCLTLGVAAVMAFGLARSGVWPSGSAAGGVITVDGALNDDLQRAWILIGGGSQTLVGDLEASSERLDEAELLIERSASAAPSSPDVHRLRGVLALARGDHAAARVALERALELQPNHHLALLTLGAVHVEAGDLEDGERVFRLAVLEWPESVEALHNLGQTLWLLGREDEALTIYRRKVALVQQAEQQLAAGRPDAGS